MAYNIRRVRGNRYLLTRATRTENVIRLFFAPPCGELSATVHCYRRRIETRRIAHVYTGRFPFELVANTTSTSTPGVP